MPQSNIETSISPLLNIQPASLLLEDDVISESVGLQELLSLHLSLYSQLGQSRQHCKSSEFANNHKELQQQRQQTILQVQHKSSQNSDCMIGKYKQQQPGGTTTVAIGDYVTVFIPQ